MDSLDVLPSTAFGLTKQVEKLEVFTADADHFAIAYLISEKLMLCVFYFEYFSNVQNNVQNSSCVNLPPAENGRLLFEGALVGSPEDSVLLELALSFRLHQAMESARWQAFKSYSFTFFWVLASLCVYVSPAARQEVSPSGDDDEGDFSLAHSESISSFLEPLPVPETWDLPQGSALEDVFLSLLQRAQTQADSLLASSLFCESSKRPAETETRNLAAESSLSKRLKTEEDPTNDKEDELMKEDPPIPMLRFGSAIVQSENAEDAEKRIRNYFLVSLPPQVLNEVANIQPSCKFVGERVYYGPLIAPEGLNSPDSEPRSDSNDSCSSGSSGGSSSSCCSSSSGSISGGSSRGEEVSGSAGSGSNSGSGGNRSSDLVSAGNGSDNRTVGNGDEGSRNNGGVRGSNGELAPYVLRFIEQQSLSRVGGGDPHEGCIGDGLLDVLPLLDCSFKSRDPIEGPLLFSQHSAGKNVLDLQSIHHPPPSVLLRFEQRLRELPFAAVNHWEDCCLAPFSKNKDVEFVVIPPPPTCARARERHSLVNFFRSLQCVYEACHLGTHRSLFSSCSSSSPCDFFINVTLPSSDPPSASSNPPTDLSPHIQEYYERASLSLISKIDHFLAANREQSDTLIIYVVCDRPVLLSEFCKQFSVVLGCDKGSADCPASVLEYITRNSIVIHFVSLASCQSPSSSVLRELAWTVYNKVCRPIKVTRYHRLELHSETCFEPAVILCTEALLPSPMEHLQTSQKAKPVTSIHLAYSWSEGKGYLCGVCVDGRAETLLPATVRHSHENWSDVNALVTSFRLLWFKTGADALNIVPQTHAVRVVITKLGVMELSERESWERVFLLRDDFGAVHAATMQFAEEREEKKAAKQQICDVFLLSANYSAFSHPLQVVEEASDSPANDSFVLHAHEPLGRTVSGSPALATANLYFRRHATGDCSPGLTIPFSLLKQHPGPAEKQSASSLKGSQVSSTSLELSLVSFLFNFAALDRRPTSVNFSSKDFIGVLSGISRQFLDFSCISLPSSFPLEDLEPDDANQCIVHCATEPRLPLHLAVVRRLAALVTRILAE